MSIIAMYDRGGDDLLDLRHFRSYYPDKEIDDDDDEYHVKKCESDDGSLHFNQQALQRYILHCAQETHGLFLYIFHHGNEVISVGGGRDKPGKSRDFYHTCYSLSGLSLAQHSYLCSEHQLVNMDDSRHVLVRNDEL